MPELITDFIAGCILCVIDRDSFRFFNGNVTFTGK